MKLFSKNTLTDAAGLVAGGVGTNVVSRYIPVANPMLKNGIVIALGAVLSGKKGFIGNVGKGMVAAGGSRLVSSLVPGLAGDDDMSYVAEVINDLPENIINGADDSIINGIEVNTAEDLYK